MEALFVVQIGDLQIDRCQNIAKLLCTWNIHLFPPSLPSLTDTQQHDTQPRTLPPAALPSLFVVTSTKAPNHGVAAPYECIAGAGWLGSRSLGLVPLSGVPKLHRSKKREMGGASALVARHSMK